METDRYPSIARPRGADIHDRHTEPGTAARRSNACGDGLNNPQLTPDLEVVGVPGQSSFKVWSHGYPFRTVRWHFHPEYEIHLVTETTGRSFVGDYIGTFEPGNLVLIGPYLPHNWISDLAKGQTIARRGLVVQFTPDFIGSCIGVMPELQGLDALLSHSASGLEFVDGTGAAAHPIIEAMLDAEGAARIALFFGLLDLLVTSRYRQLASENYQVRPETYAAEPLNHVLDHIAKNSFRDLRQTELAELSGFSPSGFSRAFRQHTGLPFVRYLNEIRVNRACELLMTGDESVARICFAVGFNNLSNFNRHFAVMKGMAPSAFRRWHRENTATRFADGPPTVENDRAAADPMMTNLGT